MSTKLHFCDITQTVHSNTARAASAPAPAWCTGGDPPPGPLLANEGDGWGVTAIGRLHLDLLYHSIIYEARV